MSNDANLSCFRCAGEFESVGANGSDLLFECRECGTELTEEWTREVAELDDGPMARLAEVLLERAGESR